MLYVVECGFDDPARESDWNTWYSGHLPYLVQVPGIHTGQRFRKIGEGKPKYRALYTVDSPEVFVSEGYLSRKGGRFPQEWQVSIVDWQRNVFANIDRVPEVGPESTLLFIDSGTLVPDKIDATWLPTVGLNRSVPEIGFAVIDAAAGRDLSHQGKPGLGVYEAITPQIRKP